MQSCGVILFIYNARLHVMKVVHEALAQKGWEVLPHTAYSPYLLPYDFHLITFAIWQAYLINYNVVGGDEHNILLYRIPSKNYHLACSNRYSIYAPQMSAVRAGYWARFLHIHRPQG